MTKKRKRHAFGNSVLFINLKFWTCAYCGKLIKNKTPFSVVLIDGNPSPFILCSANCLKIQVIKLDAQKADRP